MALSEQPPNPLFDKFLQSLRNTPIQYTAHPTTSRQESLVNILLPSLFGSKTHSNKTKSEKSQSNHLSPKRLPTNSTALGTSTQDARATFTTKSNSAKSAKSQTEAKRKSLSASKICQKASVQRPFTLPTN